MWITFRVTGQIERKPTVKSYGRYILIIRQNEMKDKIPPFVFSEGELSGYEVEVVDKKKDKDLNKQQTVHASFMKLSRIIVLL